MSSAYGHVMAPMRELVDNKPLASAHREAKWVPEKHWESINKVSPGHWSPNCSGRSCEAQPQYASRYSYVTGRAGRITDRIQYWCPKCAEAWAKRHKVEFKPLPPTSEVSHAATTG